MNHSSKNKKRIVWIATGAAALGAGFGVASVGVIVMGSLTYTGAGATIDQALAAPFGHQGLRVEYTTYQSHQAPGAERIVLSLVHAENIKAHTLFKHRKISA